MRFIVDAQLPPALARLLGDYGHTTEHVADIGMRDADDSPIWDYALEHGAVILTKDEDFPHRQKQSPQACPVIVWLRIGNTSRRALLPRIESLVGQGNRFVEVRFSRSPEKLHE